MESFDGTSDRLDSDLESEAVTASALRPTLREDSRSRASMRIVDGALVAMARSGLDVTIDEVADTAGVSRRTVFRHFASHGELIAAAISKGLSVLGTHIPSVLAPGTDVESWLNDTVVTLHTILRQLLGRAFWDIHIDRPGTPPEVLAAIEDIAIQRKRFTDGLADAAWAALGGENRPPRWVIDAFSQQVSGFATYALPGYSPQETGQLSARILWLVLGAALEEQRQETKAVSERAARGRPAR
jgi:AcrR family transcriptional regulator